MGGVGAFSIDSAICAHDACSNLNVSANLQSLGASILELAELTKSFIVLRSSAPAKSNGCAAPGFTAT